VKWQIPYDGRTWEFDDGRITASEARTQKRLTDGLMPTAADSARLALDPDAWVAALVIARRRAGLSAEDAVAVDDAQLELSAITDATKAFYEAASPDEAADETDESEPADEAAA
jgi:hypothetical protein